MKERPLVAKLVSDIRLPRMFKVRQKFSREHINKEEIPDIIFKLLSEEKFASRIKPGMSIAITAGSRGIANVALITKSIADFVKSRGASPFVVPAMGSHGGATAEGQREILTGYGITEEYIGCPIVSSMEVVKIGVNDEGGDVFIDKHAAEAGGIIVSCRIKPHTSFRGPYESGIMKMMAIGLGKQHGAEVCHSQGYRNMAKNIPLFGRCILKNAPVLFAVPVIENAFDETHGIYAVAAEDVETEEPKLLKKAFSLMPRILVDSCDVLVVDQIGKNFSGTGMDPNVTGTFISPYVTGGIKSQRVVVLDLSEESHGNAIGIGCATVTTKRLSAKIDYSKMYPNVITSTTIEEARVPMTMESDEDAIRLAVKTCSEIDKANPRIVRIPNSLHIEHIMLSEAYLEEARANDRLEIESAPEYMKFNEEGNLF